MIDGDDARVSVKFELLIGGGELVDSLFACVCCPVIVTTGVGEDDGDCCIIDSGDCYRINASVDVDIEFIHLFCHLRQKEIFEFHHS